MQAAPLVDGFGRVHIICASASPTLQHPLLYCMPRPGGVRRTPRDPQFRRDRALRAHRGGAGYNQAPRDRRRAAGAARLPVLIRRLAAIRACATWLSPPTRAAGGAAGPLYEAGLRRLNVHLDTLDAALPPNRAPDDLDKCWPAWRRRAGSANDHQVERGRSQEPDRADIVLLARFGRERGFEVRYIEFMPLDAQNLWDAARCCWRMKSSPFFRAKSRRSNRARPRSTRAGHEYAFADGIAKWVSSLPSAVRSAATATGCVSPPMASCAIVCLRLKRTTKRRRSAPARATKTCSPHRSNAARKWAGHEINSSKFVAPPRL